MERDFNKQATGQLGGPQSSFQGGYRQQEQVTPKYDGVGAVLSGLGKLAGDLGKQRFISETEREYVRGARERHLGKSFEDVENNIFSRPFQRGGYQDQDYRIKQAELTGTVQDFISKEGKRATPEEFQKYLAEKSSELFDSVGEGMSRIGRDSMVSTQMDLEQTLMDEHNAAYQKNNIREAGIRVSTAATSIIAGANVALAEGRDLSPYAQQAAGLLDSLQDQFPEEMQAAITVDFMKELYQEGQVEIGNALFDAVSRAGVIDRLPLEERHKIGAAKKTAMSATEGRRAGAIIAQHQQYLERIAAGEMLPRDEIVQFVTQYADSTYLSERDALQLMKHALASPEDSKNQQIAEAYTRADDAGQTTVRALGSNPIKAVEIQADYLFAKVYPDDPALAVATSLKASLAQGAVATRTMQEVEASMRAIQMSEDGTLTQGQEAILNSAVEAVLYLDSNDRTAAIAAMTTKLPEELQPVLYKLTTMGRDEYKTQSVFQHIQDIENGLAAAAEGDRGASSVQLQRAKSKVQDGIDDLLDANFITRGWRRLVRGEFAPKPGSRQEQELQWAVQQEVAINVNNPDVIRNYGNNPQYILDKAMADVHSRTINVKPKGGEATAVIMPKVNGRVKFKEDVYAVLGEDGKRLVPDADSTQFGEAIAKLYAPISDSHEVVFVAQDNGDILVAQVSEDGTYTDADRIVDVEEVAQQMYQDLLDRTEDYSNVHYGAVVSVDTGATGKQQMHLSGMNTQGVTPESVYDWRKTLVKQEGYKRVTYKDGKGVTAGVGHQMPAGTSRGVPVRDADIWAWFEQDTDNAITTATQLANEYGIEDTDERTILAMASAVFQLGDGGFSEFGETLEIIAAAEDYSALVERSKKWAWTEQTPERVQWFLKEVKGRFDANKPRR